MKKQNKKNIHFHAPRHEMPISPYVILDKLRVINLFGEIDEYMSRKIIKEIIKLSYLSNEPITMLINSEGGSCIDGLAIVDAMNMCSCPIYTIITGMSASMAGVISVCGDVRAITENGFWMSHPMAGGTYDYKKFLIDYVDFLKVVDKKILKIIVSRTNLDDDDINKMSNGELWLDAEQCVAKGVCTQIIQPNVSANTAEQTIKIKKTKKAKQTSKIKKTKKAKKRKKK